MKIKSIVHKIGLIIFSLCLISLGIGFFFNININFASYFLHFWICYSLSLLLLLFTSYFTVFQKIISIIFIGIAPIIASFFLLINTVFTEHRTNIPNSSYNLVAYMHEYKLLEQYFIFEKIIAVKESEMFLERFSKTGITRSIKVNLISETTDTITLEVETLKHGKVIEKISRTVSK